MSCSNCNCYIPEREYENLKKNGNSNLCKDCRIREDKKIVIIPKKKKESTPEAIKLHRILIENGFDAKLKNWDGNKYVDISIPDFKINIEIESEQIEFNEEKELINLKRTFHSFKKGYATLRIPYNLVKKNTYATAKYIMKFLKESEMELSQGLE